MRGPEESIFRTLLRVACGLGVLTAVEGLSRAAAPASASTSSCITCHGQLEGSLGDPVKVWFQDAHGAAGLGCESCHGGDPSPALAANDEAAMNPARGYRPAPGRLQVAEFCARCHADASFMKQYNPQMRVDQLAEYRTSVHGRKNAAGDPVPATCTDCHGSHGIRPVSSPDSPVYSVNVPGTCARCHSDQKKMGAYGLRADQYDLYRGSVHGAALLGRSDTAAPACNDCHGNHGASPPDVQSVANVCGQCHGREAALFGASIKKELFEAQQVGECTVCHDHHRIRHPTPELFHGDSAPQITSGSVLAADPFSAKLGEIAGGGKAAASWRVVLRPHVAPDDPKLLHRIEVGGESIEPIVLDATVRPGAALPPQPARGATSGLSASLTIDAPSGEPVEAGDALIFRVDVRVAEGPAIKGVTVRDIPGEALYPHAGSACLTCHTPGDSCDKATEKMYAALVSLDRDLRQSSSLLHRAEVAGMDVSGPLFELKSKGTTAGVEARALIHSFDPGRLIQRTTEGEKVAGEARRAGEAALAELQFRRKGLAVSLVLVGLVLAGLFLKIRQVDRARR